MTAVSLFLVALAAMGALAMGRTLLDHQKLNQRRRNLWQAFLAAESGVALVQHWALNPESFGPDPTLFGRSEGREMTGDLERHLSGEKGPQTADARSDFSELLRALERGPITIDAGDLERMGVGSLSNAAGGESAVIARIDLIPSSSADPVPCLFKVRSTGRAGVNVERTVIAYIEQNGLIFVRAPAALVSLASPSQLGNAIVHWGEVWSKEEFPIPSLSELKYIARDKNAAYRSEAGFGFGDLAWKEFLVPEWMTSSTPGAGEFATKFLQFEPEGKLDWPDFQARYSAFQDHARAHGRYYTIDPGGRLFRGPREVDFLEEFGLADPDTNPYDLVFIEYVDEDGSPILPERLTPLPTLKIEGEGLGIKGIFYINANVDAREVHAPPLLTAFDPKGHSERLRGVFLDGAIYSAGEVTLGREAGVYGSLVASRGFNGVGAPDLYYNTNLADGVVFGNSGEAFGNGNVGSPFKVILQTNLAPEE